MEILQNGQKLLDYGILGFFTLVLILVIIVFWKRMEKRSAADAARMQKLETDMDVYRREDFKTMVVTITANTEAITANARILERITKMLPVTEGST